MNSRERPLYGRPRSLGHTLRPVRGFVYQLAVALTALTFLALTIWLCRICLIQSGRYLEQSWTTPAMEDQR